MDNEMIKCAYADILVVNRLLHYPTTDDDATLGVIGYHLQQTVEKSLKALLENVGMDYRGMGHSIGKCLRAVNNHLPGVLPDDTVEGIRPYVNILTDWETHGRYPSSFTFTISELKRMEVVVRQLYNDAATYFHMPSYVPEIKKLHTEPAKPINLFERRKKQE